MSKLKENRKKFEILSFIVMVIISRGFQKIRDIDIIRIYTVSLLLVLVVLIVHNI